MVINTQTERQKSELTSDDLIPVLVFPDGTNILKEEYNWEEFKFMGDDYYIRETTNCNDCGGLLYVDYNEPFASCKCGTTEWYK